MGHHGVRVIVGEKTRFHTAGFSKFASKTVLYPDPVRDADKFYEWLRRIVSEEQCDVVFPMDDDVMNIVIEHQNDLRRICHVPVPSAASYHIAADKRQTMRLAAETGVPHPNTAEPEFTQDVNDDVLLQLVKSMKFPVVVKPRYSSGARGIRFAQEPGELPGVFREVHEKYPNPIIQEAVPFGPKYDVCLLYGPDHTLKAHFIQKQLRNYPLERGPSTVRQSVHHPELLNYATQLMAPLQWFGVVDVEFMIDPLTGEAKLMEINPRFWSSLHLAIDCGVDFPWLLCQLTLGYNTVELPSYESGRMGRSLLPSDILHYLSNPNRNHLEPSFFDTNILDDTVSRSDPWPTVGFLLSALRRSLDIETWRLLVKR